MAGLKCSKDVLQNQLLSIPQLWFPPHWLHPQTCLLQGVAVIITRSSWLTFHHLASSDSSNKNLGLTSIGLTRLTYPSVNQGSSLSGWASVAWPLLTQGGAVSPVIQHGLRLWGMPKRKLGYFSQRRMEVECQKQQLSHTDCAGPVCGSWTYDTSSYVQCH